MGKSNKALIPALVAVGGGLATAPSSALELGEISVQSTLGQPLRASIAYALAPNEQIGNYCVALHPGFGNSGLPAVSRANINVANGVISITGTQAVREPLMMLRLDVACPYSPNLSREYMMFIDLPGAEAQQQIVVNSIVAKPAIVEVAPAIVADTSPRPTPRARRVERAAQTPIATTERYRVQPGDSLSAIAERIENRPIGLWAAVTQIFDANPDAFIDNDPNKLKAGSLLTMPDFGVQGATPAIADTSSVVDTADVIDTTDTADVVETTDSATDTTTISPVVVQEPGEIVNDGQSPFVSGEVSTVVIPDTELEAPTTASSPNVPVATIAQPEPIAPNSSNWLLWLVGGGIALIVGLLAFGLRSRGRGAPAPVVEAPAHPMRRRSDTATVEILQQDEYEFNDDASTEENLTLDADLVLGTGLDSGVEISDMDIDVAEDFGFSTALDLEFPEEANSDDPIVETDIISAHSIEQSSILDSEVLTDDDDYDMSVIVDATKMPHPDEVTEHDLKAIVVDGTNEALDADNYTLSQEVDYQILEQDYEEELTATQALNVEIEKAAAQLAQLADEHGPDAETAQLPLATVTELDVTSNLSATDDATVEITQELAAEDKTVEMPANDDVETIEMTIESGKIDTKAG